MNKVLSLKRLLAVLRERVKTVVFTNGCFDIIHAGHIRYLKKAKTLGDILVIGLNSDISVKKIKGDKRPIVSQKERAEVLSAMEMVDYIVIFNEPTPIRLIKAIQPDVLVKGADWKEKEIVGADVVKAKGGRVVRIRLTRGRSTTDIIQRVLKLHH